MLRECIERILQEYPDARKQEFTGHRFASWLRHDVPRLFAAVAPQYPSLAWNGSAGQGQWADSPWIAAFDPLVTETAQEGYYPVYLFTKSLDAVYLSLNQGMARLRDELGTRAKEVLGHRASILRARLGPAIGDQFDVRPIDLQAEGPQTRLAFYESGHVFGVRYARVSLPSENELINELRRMLFLYERATVLGGTQEMDTTGHAVPEQGVDSFPTLSLEEKRRLRYHFRVERNQRLARLAKEVHGCRCQVCGFDFRHDYGELGDGYIEAHHLTPLSDLPPNKPVSLSPASDFAVVCANCHRMIHRRGAPVNFDEFRRRYPLTRR